MSKIQSAVVYWNGEAAGLLTRHHRRHYVFEYFEEWFTNPEKPAVSLTLPKTKRRWEADHLFPFFFNMLSEGFNKRVQCRFFRIDENDFFTHLVKTAGYDTAGAVTIRPADESEQLYADD
ncbi:serine/threonine-protein kinase HipA [Cyclonatronum proteinivorum]|uniref:Serine/threonine-protein kinase HipA n=1 Tax=Cyclonatronum proteinivorum TaxID=1457365 RepID=A0A345UGS4_9BACT|nr:HipA N-terminal domain-containing protein [Cyclonatronum proteinivorum]AXI99675.1 serine/threonine-protein kinase HipA [Cyclonatronum proteinivorum]